MAGALSRCAYCVVAAGNIVRSFFVFLAYFGGLTKSYMSAYLGGLTLVLWFSCPGVGLFGWLGGFPGSLGQPACLFLPF